MSTKPKTTIDACEDPGDSDDVIKGWPKIAKALGRKDVAGLQKLAKADPELGAIIKVYKTQVRKRIGRYLCVFAFRSDLMKYLRTSPTLIDVTTGKRRPRRSVPLPA